MKKNLLIGFLLLTVSCQTATSTPAPVPSPTETPPASRTPIPATAKSTLPPPPTLTATAFPRFFTHEFDSSLAGWVILQAGNDSAPIVGIENGNLVLRMDSPYTWLYALYGAQDYSDVRIDAKFENRALTPASIGLVCRYSEEKGWFEYNLSADGTYNVLYGRWLTVGIADYLPILDGSSNEIQPSGATQTMGLTCSDTTLWLYINEKLIRKVDVARYELTGGKVGIAASSFENTPIIAAFDWVRVSESLSP